LQKSKVLINITKPDEFWTVYHKTIITEFNTLNKSAIAEKVGLLSFVTPSGEPELT